MLKLNFPSSKGTISAQTLPELISAANQTRLTGLLYCDAQPNSVGVFSQSKILHGYEAKDSSVARISAASVESTFLNAIHLVQLPASLIHFSKIKIENANLAKEINLSETGLTAFLSQTENHLQTSLLEIFNTKQGLGFILLGGLEQKISKAVVWDSENWQTDEAGQTALNNLLTQNIRARLYPYDKNNEAWQEVYLNTLFEFLINTLFERLAALTGRVMIGSIARELILFGGRNNLKLKFENNKFSTSTLFSSATEMAKSHRICLNLVIQQIEAVIGIGMMTLMIQRLYNGTNPQYKAVAQHHHMFFE